MPNKQSAMRMRLLARRKSLMEKGYPEVRKVNGVKLFLFDATDDYNKAQSIKSHLKSIRRTVRIFRYNDTYVIYES